MSRILIYTGFTIPSAARLLNMPESPWGGWVSTLLDGLMESSRYTIGIAMKSTVTHTKKIDSDGITYYFLPTSKKDKNDINIEDCNSVLSDFNPDILHCEGAEIVSANTILRSCNCKALISIKGIINGIQPYEYGGLDIFKLLFSRHLLFALSLIYKKHYRLNRRLLKERESYKMVGFVSGRTNWDKAHSYILNPQAKYYYASEIIRASFFNHRWSIENVERYSIFISNATVARKGAHIVLNAVQLLLKEFPNIKLYIAGGSGNNNISFKQRIGYEGYFYSLVKEKKLERQIVSLGTLNELNMAKEMTCKHVFILPSTIENSSNTLSEAMMLGMPCIASYCGGTMDLCTSGEDAIIYRDDDASILAYRIRELFLNDNLAVSLGNRASIRARKTHDMGGVISAVSKMYDDILK